MNITVYTKPECQPCKAVKRKLEELKIEYSAVDVTEDPDAAETVTNLGYLQAPVVVVNLGEGATWSFHGYAPTRIKQLQKYLATGEIPLGA